MNKEEEKQYWPRVVRETQKLSHMTLQQLADKVGICVRELVYLKAGRRPTGIVAVRLYLYRAQLFVEEEKKEA